MPPSRFQLLKATTRSPWTRDFRHLLPVPKHFAIKQSFYDPGIKAVRVKDRIKFWNVVPGDRIRIRGDSRNTIHEVLSINKFTNRVYLKGTIRVRFTPAPLAVAHMAVGTNQGQDAGEQERTLLEMSIINRGTRKEDRGRNYRESAVSISPARIRNVVLFLSIAVSSPNVLVYANPTGIQSFAALTGDASYLRLFLLMWSGMLGRCLSFPGPNQRNRRNQKVWKKANNNLFCCVTD